MSNFSGIFVRFSNSFVSNTFRRHFISSGNQFYRSHLSTGLLNSVNASSKPFARHVHEQVTKPVEATPKIVGVWLAGCSFMVATTLLIGGYTRLKNAGLSMVNWKLFGDMVYPRTEDKWKELYEEYKKYPEYSLSINEITLRKFKRIYFLEFLHRMWGRLTGAVFFIPAVFLFATGKLRGPMVPRAIIYNLMVLLQGAMGWYMVKSGLKEDTMANSGEPGVSQHRLAAHLTAAMILYSLTFYQCLNILLPYAKDYLLMGPNINKGLVMLPHISLLGIILTSIYGGYVAGLDAGKACSTYPLMNGKVIPEGIHEIQPIWRNYFENPITVQFIHRVLGHITALIVLSCLALTLVQRKMHRRAIIVALCMGGSVLNQIHTGISTVNSSVDIEQAVKHQFNMLLLLSFSLWLALEFKRIKKGEFIKLI